MDTATGFSFSLTRLEAALDRLEAVAVRTGGGSEDARVAALEAERDLVQLKQRRLLQNAERAVADLDALITSRGG